MSHVRTHDQGWNPWKFTTIGMALVLATSLITGVVVANYVGQTNPPGPDEAVSPGHAAARGRAAGVAPPARARDVAPPAPAPAVRQARVEPTSADIDACNRYASSASRGKTQETVTDALIGGALGAGLGAAGGAIAGGGSGAGKGAGIGALVGAAGGTLYGLNESNRTDAQAAQAYRSCMKGRGYVD